MADGLRGRIFTLMTRAAHAGGADRSADVLIAGGGVAALETLMALRALAGERAGYPPLPAPDFVHRPLSVGEPFGLGAPQRRPLAQIAADFGAEARRAAVAAVDASGHRVVLGSGDTLGYDVLVLAPGARTLPAFDDAVTFGGPESAATMRALLDGLERGELPRLAFVAPTMAGWTLPLYGSRC